MSKPRREQAVRVWIFSKHGEWNRGEILRCGWSDSLGASIWLRNMDRPLQGGDSGGPVVDDNGRLIGVVSHGTHDGTIPIAYRALPVAWVDDIRRAQIKAKL
jgi:S1-C subfamily serine protease